MKLQYEIPGLEIIEFAMEDIVTVSGLTNGGSNDGISESLSDIIKGTGI